MLKKLSLFEVLIFNFFVLFIFSYVVNSYLMAFGFLYELISIAFILLLIIFQTYLVFKRGKLLSGLYFILALAMLLFSIRVGGINGYISIVADGISSYPTITHGDRGLVDPKPAKLTPGRFILFSRDDGRFYAKRVHGVPGDDIKICNHLVYVNGYHYSLANNWVGQLLNESERCSSRQSVFTLKANEYFVLGDNLRGSIDSRHFGPVNLSRVKGEVLYKFGPRYGANSIFLEVSFQR